METRVFCTLFSLLLPKISSQALACLRGKRLVFPLLHAALADH